MKYYDLMYCIREVKNTSGEQGEAEEELKELIRLAEIGRALEWAEENKQSSWVSVVDTPRGSFCNGLDIDFLLKLAKEE